MNIRYKKNFLYIDDFKLKCCIGKAGIKKRKKEGDKSTPLGIFKLGELYVRNDRLKNIRTNLNKIYIKRNMAWCDDSSSKKYNKLFTINKKTNFSYEKLFRNDYKYDLLIPIFYNYFSTKKNLGSAIFIHLTKDYRPTKGCIALKLKDFRILIKLIKKNSKIIIKN